MSVLEKVCIKDSFIDWTAWHTNTEAARVSVLKRILKDPTTDSRHNLFLVGERVENFEAEDRTVARIKDLESSPKLEKGASQYEEHQQTFMECMMELIMMNALVYDTEGRTAASASSSTSTASPPRTDGCRDWKYGDIGSGCQYVAATHANDIC